MSHTLIMYNASAVSQSVCQSISLTEIQSVADGQTVGYSVCQSVIQSVGHFVSQSIIHSLSQSFRKSVIQSVI